MTGWMPPTATWLRRRGHQVVRAPAGDLEARFAHALAHGSLVVLGGFGSGKTETSRRVGARLGVPVVPLRVVARAADPDRRLRELAPGDVAILDGLDEIGRPGEGGAQAFMDRVTSAFRHWVLTSRPGHVRTDLADPDPGQADCFHLPLVEIDPYPVPAGAPWFVADHPVLLPLWLRDPVASSPAGLVGRALDATGVAARLQALAWRAFLDPEASREGASFAARELEDLPRHLFVEDLDGRWRFGHRSLWDALVAREIGPRLAAGQGAGPDALTGLHLSGAMRAFLAGEFPGWSRDDAWTLVPRGNFVSGGSRSSDERPLVIRHLPAPVRVARRAVSNAEFSTFLDETGPRPPWIGLLASWRGGPCPDSLRHHPVHDLRPEDCDAYARWAGARLPTPDEWEKAARGWDGRNFPWGDEPDPARCHAAEGLPDATVPVATHDQGSGLFDIVGNAFECTSGYYRDRMDRGRVVMGGSYAHAMMRASLRLSHTLSGHLRVGLRTAT